MIFHYVINDVTKTSTRTFQVTKQTDGLRFKREETKYNKVQTPDNLQLITNNKVICKQKAGAIGKFFLNMLIHS